MTEQQRKYYAIWRNAHREEIREYQKKYRQTEKYKQYHREKQREWYKEHKEYWIKATEKQKPLRQTEEYKRNMRGYIHNHNQQLKERVLGYYSNGQPKCVRCGNSDLRVLSLDHIANNGYQHRKEVGAGYSIYRWAERNNYPKGLQALCMNCQWIKRAEKEALLRRE